MFELFKTSIAHIQELSAITASILSVCCILLYVYNAAKSSLLARTLLFLLTFLVVIWENQFFNGLIAWLIVCEHLIIFLPLWKKDINYPSGLRYLGIKMHNIFIPNAFIFSITSQVIKIALFVLLGLNVFSLIWFIVLLIIMIFAFFVELKTLQVYHMFLSENPKIPYGKNFTIMTPFDSAYFVPYPIYNWVSLILGLFTILNRDYRTTFGSTDIRKRANSLEKNSDSTIHIVFIVFVFSTIYFSNNLYNVIVLLTLASVFRLVLSEAFRKSVKFNKIERKVVISTPSFNKEHYSRLIDYVTPNGDLWTNGTKGATIGNRNFIKFYFPQFSSYYTRGKQLLTSELTKSPLLTHVLFSEHIYNEERLATLKRGLNSVFGILEIHVIEFFGLKNIEKQQVEILGFLCDEELQDLELSHEEIEARKIHKNANSNSLTIASLARERLAVSGSYESLRLNILFLDSIGEKEKEYHDSLQGLPFDFFTIHRQLYEIPSHSGRFGEMFHIFEMVLRYLSCCAKIELGEGYPERGLVSMGATVSELRYYSKLTFDNSDFERGLSAFLSSKELDSSSIKVLISTLKQHSPAGTKFSPNPTVATLFDWITTLRNRTKGHGSTSKVDPRLVYALNTLMIELLIHLKHFNLKFSYASVIEGYHCEVRLNEGGLPNYKLITREEYNLQSFQRKNKLKISMVGLGEYKECLKWFKSINGRVYVFDGIDISKNKIYWYNFLTSTRVAEGIDQEY